MASGNRAGSAGAPATTGLRYPVLFLLLSTLAAGACAVWNEALSPAAVRVTVAAVRALAPVFGATLAAGGDVLSVNGFAMRIVFECTALQYVLILSLAILLYTPHGIGYRIFGAALAAVVLPAANALRLIFTGMIGAVSREGFVFVHEYLWVALFALLVFGFWKGWVDGRFRPDRKGWLRIGRVVCCGSAVFLLLFAFRDLHYRLLTTLAAPLLRLLLADPQATAAWDGALVFSGAGGAVRMANYFELANFAVYLGLVLPRMGEGRGMRRAALAGAGLLFAAYAELIAVLGANCLRHVERAALYQGIGSGILLALPMAVYWMASRLAEKEGSAEG